MPDKASSAVDVPALLREVGIDSLYAHVEQLARVRSPYDDIGVLHEVVHYVETHLRATSLSVRTLPTEKDGFELPTVVARVRGAELPDKVLVLGAHYDSVRESPGADDNASGVAINLEFARVLSRYRLPHSIDLAFFPFEEKPGDLAGARELAASYVERGEHVQAMVSLEMLGFTAPQQHYFPPPGDFIALIGDQRSAAFVGHFRGATERWNPGLRAIGAAVDPEQQPDAKRSDHAAFWDEGIPALMATDTSFLRNEHYHTESDTIDTLDFRFMRSAARSVLAGALTLADEETVLVGLEPVTTADSLRLMTELSAELSQRYDEVDDGSGGFDGSALGERGAFFVARRGGEAVGCAALVPVDDATAEVKRVFVTRKERGKGVSKILLYTLEAFAYGQAFGRVRLETGNRQPESIGLYERLGYERIERWAEYANSERSICMAKTLLEPVVEPSG